MVTISAAAAQEKTMPADVPDEIMAQVIARVLRDEFRPQKAVLNVRLQNTLIRESWLPTIRNIRFTLFSRDKDRESEIGSYFFLPPEIEPDGRHSIKFGKIGPNCSAGGSIWYFNFQGSNVWMYKHLGGWGSGCAHGNGQ